VIVFREEGGKGRYKSGGEGAACQQVEEKIGKNVCRVKSVHGTSCAEGAGSQNLTNQPGELAEGKGKHDSPGGAGNLLVGFTGGFTH
jgi:hypothetical protein